MTENPLFSNQDGLPSLPPELARALQEKWGMSFPVDEVSDDTADEPDSFMLSDEDQRLTQLSRDTFAEILEHTAEDLLLLPAALANDLNKIWGSEYPSDDSVEE